jgi:hypothetical protein
MNGPLMAPLAPGMLAGRPIVFVFLLRAMKVLLFRCMQTA